MEEAKLLLRNDLEVTELMKRKTLSTTSSSGESNDEDSRLKKDKAIYDEILRYLQGKKNDELVIPEGYELTYTFSNGKQKKYASGSTYKDIEKDLPEVAEYNRLIQKKIQKAASSDPRFKEHSERKKLATDFFKEADEYQKMATDFMKKANSAYAQLQGQNVHKRIREHKFKLAIRKLARAIDSTAKRR